ncbi:hypothetical protein D7X48_20605 [bacterium D16-50]|nr:hypothetical protein D7X48_20605 [bacterium D16-50]
MDRGGDSMKRENADYATERASARRRKRTREMRTFALLVCLVVMTAVLYLAVSIFSWIDGRMKDGEGAVLPVTGDGVENPDAAGSVSGGDASDGSQSADGSGESSGAVSGAGSNSVVYSQEDLEGYMAVAKAEAAEEVLDSIRRGLNDGGSLLETLRPLFPEEMIVYSGGKYNFVPINRSLKQSVLVEENLNILETGEYQYLQDGQVISHKGIDVSKHQGVIDWNLVAQDGVEFAFIRVGNRGYGTGKMVEDERFDANIQGASAAGIKVGVYYYSQAITREEVLEEANFVLEKIKPYEISCPVVFDVERVSGEPGRMNDISVEERTEFTRLFCETIQNAGYRPMIYHNTEMGAMMINLEPLEEYDKWFAAYSDQFYYPYEYKIWQYSQSGRVQGIKGAVDLNISFGPIWEE